MKQSATQPGNRSLLAQWRRTFTEHPEEVGETYFQHLKAAAGFSGQLLVAAGAALTHALIPSLCKHTARHRIAALHARLQSRAHPDTN